MNHEVIEAFRAHTAHAPALAKDRVWQRLAAPRRPVAALRFSLAGAALAAAVAAVVVASRAPAAPAVMPVPLRGNGFVVLAADASLSGRVLTVRSGTALVSSWGGAVDVTAGGHHAVSDAALFAVQVAGEQVSVSVDEGVVKLDGEPVSAPRAGVDTRPVRAFEPEGAQVERDWALADGADASGRVDEAIARFATLGEASSLRAEAALLRKAELELWRQQRPDSALATLDTAQRRFPNGALQQEAALFELEALVATAQWQAAAAKSQQFAARFPASERLAEVELVAAVAAAQLGDLPGACRHFARVDVAALLPQQTTTAQSMAARCRHFER